MKATADGASVFMTKKAATKESDRLLSMASEGWIHCAASTRTT